MAAVEYKPDGSTVTAATLAKFVALDLLSDAGSNSLNEVPGIGPEAISLLKGHGVKSAAGLCGKFMTFYEDGMSSKDILVRLLERFVPKDGYAFNSGPDSCMLSVTIKYLAQDAFAVWLTEVGITRSRNSVVHAVANKCNLLVKGVVESA